MFFYEMEKFINFFSAAKMFFFFQFFTTRLDHNNFVFAKTRKCVCVGMNNLFLRLDGCPT